MKGQDKYRFTTNLAWFNRFFEDLKELLDKISGALEIAFPVRNVGIYYPKFKHQPSIPPYYLAGMGGDKFAVQVFAVIDPDIMVDQPAFANEPSLVVVKHSQGDKGLWPEDFGLRVLTNDRIQQTQATEKIIQGVIKGDSDTVFTAFQVPLDHFMEGKDINAAIEKEIVDVLK